MAIIEGFIEAIGQIFAETFINKFLFGIYKFIKYNVLGFERIEIVTTKQKRENKFLYKNIELKIDINKKLKVGQRGTILEIINNKYFYAEFYNNKKSQIEFKDQIAFKICAKDFKLLK